jgi:hypothetical protein
MVVLIIASIIAGVVLSMVSRAFTPSMGGMGMGMDKRSGDATITTPKGNATITTTPSAGGAPDTAAITIKTPDGEVKIDAQKMEALAKQMEEMAKKMEQAKK